MSYKFPVYLQNGKGARKLSYRLSHTVANRGFLRTVFSVTASIFFCIFLFYMYNRSSVQYSLYYAMIATLPESHSCAIPRPDPWDPTILGYLATPNPLSCKKLQPELTYMTDNGELHFNASAMNEAGYASLSCQYRCFDRKENTDDDTLDYGPWIDFKEKANIGCEFLEVSCSKSFPSVSIYSNLHNQIIANKTAISTISEPMTTVEERRRPSVLVFVIDSVSHSNFLRQLPKTYNFLTKELGAFIFSGFTKVGDNSFPNAAAMFSGKRVNVAGAEPEIQQDMSKTYFDSWPLIWKDFKKAGYVTFYAEDYPNFNLFNYLSIGFKQKPVDHYFRPYWLALWWSFLHRRSTHLCYGNSPKHMLQLNYLRQFWQKYPNSPKFAINWLTELGHDWLNQVALGDNALLSFFSNLKPLLDDTILFVLSDHGHRFDSIRETVIGRIEERMPFFSMAIPPSLRRAVQHPILLQNLLNNSKVLTSPFDLHETLLDIVRLGPGGFSDAELRQQLANRTRGHSLFRPISPDRNCNHAGVPEDFCVCLREIQISINDSMVHRAAKVLIDAVNEILFKASNLCAQLDLKAIKNAQLVLPNYNTIVDSGSKGFFFGSSSATGFFLNYRVTVEASPSSALFEATIRSVGETVTVFGDINRINRYGNQSECVKSAFLRKYCYCM